MTLKESRKEDVVPGSDIVDSLQEDRSKRKPKKQKVKKVAKRKVRGG